MTSERLVTILKNPGDNLGLGQLLEGFWLYAYDEGKLWHTLACHQGFAFPHYMEVFKSEMSLRHSTTWSFLGQE